MMSALQEVSESSGLCMLPWLRDRSIRFEARRDLGTKSSRAECISTMAVAQAPFAPRVLNCSGHSYSLVGSILKFVVRFVKITTTSQRADMLGMSVVTACIRGGERTRSNSENMSCTNLAWLREDRKAQQIERCFWTEESQCLPLSSHRTTHCLVPCNLAP